MYWWLHYVSSSQESLDIGSLINIIKESKVNGQRKYLSSICLPLTAEVFYAYVWGK